MWTYPFKHSKYGLMIATQVNDALKTTADLIYRVIFPNSILMQEIWKVYTTYKEDLTKNKCGGFTNEKWSSADDKKPLKVICLKLMASPPAFIYRWTGTDVSQNDLLHFSGLNINLKIPVLEKLSRWRRDYRCWWGESFWAPLNVRRSPDDNAR